MEIMIKSNTPGSINSSYPMMTVLGHDDQSFVMLQITSYLQSMNWSNFLKKQPGDHLEIELISRQQMLGLPPFVSIELIIIERWLHYF
jgi:hypothetical protein